MNQNSKNKAINKSILEQLAAKRAAIAKMQEEQERLEANLDALLEVAQAEIGKGLLEEAKADTQTALIVSNFLQKKIASTRARDKKEVYQYILSGLTTNQQMQEKPIESSTEHQRVNF